MKAIKSIHICFLLLFSATLFFSSCKKETCTNCELIISVKQEGTSGFLEGALVTIASSRDKLYNKDFLFQKDTDKNGEAKFELAPGKYYYRVYYIFQNSDTDYDDETTVNNTGTNKFSVTLSE